MYPLHLSWILQQMFTVGLMYATEFHAFISHKTVKLQEKTFGLLQKRYAIGRNVTRHLFNAINSYALYSLFQNRLSGEKLPGKSFIRLR